jgi:hypothetical protein
MKRFSTLVLALSLLKTASKAFAAGLVTLAAMSMVGTSLSLAAKPGGGGTGSGSTGGGTIYYLTGSSGSYQMNAMNSDGSGKAVLPVNENGTPGYLLHGGHRWFLTTRLIAGESYPNGGKRSETFAVRDDGDEDFTVQLTDDPSLNFLVGSRIWVRAETADTGLLSGLARRWVFDGVNWIIDPDSVGLYAATVLFDAQGNVIGLAAPPEMLVPVGLLPGSNQWPDVDNWQIDWSPDLTEVVYSNEDRTDLLVQDVITGAIRSLTTGALPFGAKWSPAGNLIIFANGYGGIETIAPDGTGRRQIIRPGNYYYPEFSPTGSHLLFQSFPGGWFEESDLFRATISGKSVANLTSGIAGRENIVGWR